MAIGDLGAAKGLIIFPATQAHGLGYQNDNQRADDIAREIDARATGDTSLQTQIIDVYNIVLAQETLIASLQQQIIDVYAVAQGKQPLLGYTAVRQTDNNNTIGFRYVAGVGVIARINDQFDFVVS